MSKKKLALLCCFCICLCKNACGQFSESCFDANQLYRFYQSDVRVLNSAMEDAHWLPVYDNAQDYVIFDKGDTIQFASKVWKYAIGYEDIFLKCYYCDSLSNVLVFQVPEDCYRSLLNEVSSSQPCTSFSDDSTRWHYWKSISCEISFFQKNTTSTLYFVRYHNVAQIDTLISKRNQQRFMASEILRLNTLKVETALRTADSLRYLEKYDYAVAELQAVLGLVSSYDQKINAELSLLQIDIKNQKVKNLLSDGEKLFSAKKYEESKLKYQEVIQLETTNETAQNAMLKINRILNLLEERKTTVYDYKLINPESFSMLLNRMQQDINQIVSHSENGGLHFDLNVAFDTAGKNISDIKHYSSQEENLSDIFQPWLSYRSLFPSKIENINVASLSSQEVNIQWNSILMSVKKREGKRSKVSPASVMPSSTQLIIHDLNKKDEYVDGKYYFHVKEAVTKDSTYHQIKLQSYKTVGPEAMFYSMLYPGSGTLAASQGRRGYTALTTFTLFMGGSITSLYFYKKMKNEGQNNAEALKWTHMICGGASAVVYVSDVLTAMIKGFQNLHRSKQIRKSLKNNEIEFSNEQIIIK